MIRLKYILEQSAAEIGDVPFGDRNRKTPSQLPRYLTRFEVPEEPNTPAEEALIDYLHDYFNDDNSVDPDAQIAQLLQKMLQYKSRYPEMLDPSTSALTGELVYRGTRLPLSFLTGHGFSEDAMFRAQQHDPLGYTWRKENALRGSFSINPKGKRGFFSFSASSAIAREFAAGEYTAVSGQPARLVVQNGELLVPVVLGVSTRSPKLLFNPDFSHSMGAFSGEEECIYIGTTIVADRIEIMPYTREEQEKAMRSRMD